MMTARKDMLNGTPEEVAGMLEQLSRGMANREYLAGTQLRVLAATGKPGGTGDKRARVHHCRDGNAGGPGTMARPHPATIRLTTTRSGTVPFIGAPTFQKRFSQVVWHRVASARS
jgi:hypothetical protein